MFKRRNPSAVEARDVVGSTSFVLLLPCPVPPNSYELLESFFHSGWLVGRSP